MRGIRSTSERSASVALYPDEDRQLLRCATVPFERRMFYGFLAREGCRWSEALQLTWDDLDLERGLVTLDENKTADPRVWALGRDVVRALQLYKSICITVRPFDGHDASRMAATLRRDLATAGVDRSALFERSDTRVPFHLHDLRGTFVTLALANGRSETWVWYRTGHRSSVMVNRYRRQARTATEVGLGCLGRWMGWWGFVSEQSSRVVQISSDPMRRFSRASCSEEALRRSH